MPFQMPSLSSNGWPKRTAQMARSCLERIFFSTPSTFAFRMSISTGAFSGSPQMGVGRGGAIAGSAGGADNAGGLRSRPTGAFT